MKSLLFLLVIAIVSSLPTLAQSESIVGKYKISGLVQDKNGAVFSHLNLYVQKGSDNRTFVTDINGEFTLELQLGDYEITVNKTNSLGFRAFIKVQDNRLNPDNLVFILDPKFVCCATPAGTPFPKPTSFTKASLSACR